MRKFYWSDLFSFFLNNLFTFTHFKQDPTEFNIMSFHRIFKVYWEAYCFCSASLVLMDRNYIQQNMFGKQHVSQEVNNAIKARFVPLWPVKPSHYIQLVPQRYPTITNKANSMQFITVCATQVFYRRDSLEKFEIYHTCARKFSHRH